MHNTVRLRYDVRLFLLCSLLGLTAGLFLASAADDNVVSLMRLSAYSRVSIVLLLPVCVLPFLIAVYAVSIKQWNILYLLTFCRFLGWAFGAGLCIRAFGSACWLMQPLVQFSDDVSLMLFGFFCFGIRSGAGVVKRELYVALLLVILAVIADHFIVSSFTATLF